MGGPSSTAPRMSLQEVIKEIEHSCDGKIGEGEEYRRATMVMEAVDHELIQGDYPRSISLYTKLQQRYQQLEETLGQLHQKTKSWWAHPFTSIEEFNKLVEDLSFMVNELEEQLFRAFDKEAERKCRKELKAKNYPKALLHLTLSLTLNNHQNHLLFGDRALCYWKIDAIEEAVADLEKAQQLQPTWEEGYLRLGRIFLLTGEYNKAAAAYSRGLEKLPNSEALKEAMDESTTADSIEKKLRTDISILSKRLAQLGIKPGDLTLKDLLAHFNDRVKRVYETPAPGCNQPKIVARIRALITMILHRCRFESKGVVDSLALTRDWVEFKERMLVFALETFMRVAAMILNDLEAFLSEEKLPIRFVRFTALRAAIWKALTKGHLLPKIKEGKKVLKQKIETLFVVEEANRDFQEVENKVFNLLEMNSLEVLIVPFLGLINSDQKFAELITRKTKRAQRKMMVEEDDRTYLSRFDIVTELEDLCAELTEFKYQQEEKNKRIEEQRENDEL